jgi:hypothetical protein
MDYVEIDAAGRQMMIAATELRERFAAAAVIGTHNTVARPVRPVGRSSR